MYNNELEHHPQVSDHAVHLERSGNILIATIHNPPVNAVGHAVRTGLLAALQQAQTDPKIHALLLIGSGNHFAAGADIREFNKPRQAPLLRDVCNQIEASNKPVIAAIAGNALGGGLEIAMAAHYRLAVRGSQLGLPEVKLGLLPGAGGSQRSTRLIGAAAALELMLSGHPLTAEQAIGLGLVDRLGRNARVDGLAYTHELLAKQCGVRRSSKKVTKLADPAAQQAAIAAARAKLPTQFRGLLSPALIIDCVEVACEQPFATGCQYEAAQFQRCQASPQHQALLHAFQAERAVAKLPNLVGGTIRSFTQVGVIGGGTMGAGIAVVMLDADLYVTLLERDKPSLFAGLSRIEDIYRQRVSKKRLSVTVAAARLAKLRGTVQYQILDTADLVVEAVYEDLAAKQAVFRELDAHCKPDAILASNTSYLDISAIAAVTSRPQSVIGLHFFSPAPVMRLLEVVIPPQASAGVIVSAFALARRLGKIPVRTGICDGFIGNRIMSVYRRAAEAMLEDGASPYQIDDAVRGFGFAMGPFQISDVAGGDIAWATRKRRAVHRSPQERYVQIADRLCEQGWFGQKTGRGWYHYESGSRSGQPEAAVLEIVARERERVGIIPRSFSAEEIVRRYLAAMINEGANLVEEGIALRPLDVDVVLLAGYGFPRHHGGPLHYADRIGLPKVLEDIVTFAAEDPLFWRPSPLLIRLVEQRQTFASLNVLHSSH
ncbi:3-hydroxyacyl-CoA dehydrogenase NAD-binding domain-containing protein [Chania multitudinisentens]|uniref:3-hydroxyacyl-CoA dehydrogenase NAD-binding domain-containing protein n=1 Tax=Chania multitudinisentens TaxID=1639108 RepID=UPI0003E13C4F|nr:3-hydroxyacyl-CoA dehydrogenase NAD-binding domain-containing protein [Chania multitudinisentens]